MSEVMQGAAVVVIGLAAVAYVGWATWRRLGTQPAGRNSACGGCRGCSAGGCSPPPR